jgi:alkanesulfonate monooxygenase SsuD/methylene tetrahydromethanopterin reductase-like flavin-dependent oxidoreductase (luciferase family)
MKFGIFDIPYSLDYETGDATPQDIIDWGLQAVKWADEFGFSAAFFAEHYTIGREPSPAPELMIAAASQITKTIKLGALAHLLPYHNPMSLAHRLMWLDHMTKGRYIAGIAAGAFPTDARLFDTSDRNFEMMMESLEIISAIWTRPGPWRIEGKYWTADMPEYTETWHGPHLKPRQEPHPRMAMVGMQPDSGSLKLAGRHGFIPVSQMLGAETLSAMWETYANAAGEAGLTADRSDWYVCRDFFVADTDEQAREAVLNGGTGRLWREHNHALFTEFGLAQNIAPIPPGEMTSEWMVDNFWIVGSPDTVVEKIAALQEATGGFGTLVGIAHDYRDKPEVFRHSLELTGREVAPRVVDLGPAEAEQAAIAGA